MARHCALFYKVASRVLIIAKNLADSLNYFTKREEEYGKEQEMAHDTEVQTYGRELTGAYSQNYIPEG